MSMRERDRDWKFSSGSGSGLENFFVRDRDRVRDWTFLTGFGIRDFRDRDLTKLKHKFRSSRFFGFRKSARSDKNTLKMRILSVSFFKLLRIQVIMSVLCNLGLFK